MSRAADIARAKADIDAVYADGFAEGKQAEYDAFWDFYQKKGAETNYAFTFSGSGWNENTFKPKYDMQPTNANHMFRNIRHSEWAGLDLVALLEASGVQLDFSKCTDFGATFQWAGITRIGTVDTRSATLVSTTFGYMSSLSTLDKLVVHAGLSYTNTFINDSALENLTIEGTIGQNGFNVQWSKKLNKPSITSIINALSTTTSGLTVTLSKTAVNNAFATTAGAGDGSTSAEWLALVGTRSNWTIALA